jgi:C4-dicarboxylate-specific signal transduction histidine kinase
VQVVISFLKNAEDSLLERKIEKAYIMITVDENMLSVEDNAGGIDEAIIEKIFDPYFSTKDKNGTGLGLYMSKMIVENHCQGSLRVTNTTNGAKFTIVLPYKGEE